MTTAPGHGLGTGGPDGASPVTVDVWLDPACPWAWLTSRWLVEVARVRPISLRWNVMSLVILNEAEEPSPEWEEWEQQARAAVRVLVAGRQHGGDAVVGPLYSAIGRRIHLDDRSCDATVLAEALAEAGLPPELLEAGDSDAYDEAVRAEHDRGMAYVGQEVGTPVIAVDGRGLFGPVVSPAPTGEDAGRVWDAVAVLLAHPSFFELKRTRDRRPEVR